MIKKYNNKRNIVGEIIRKHREEKNLPKTELSRKLELHGVYIDRNELYLIERNQIVVKDFELLALAKILDIDLNVLKDLID